MRPFLAHAVLLISTFPQCFSSFLVVPVILGGEKGSAVFALDADSLATLWQYRVSFHPLTVNYMYEYLTSCESCQRHSQYVISTKSLNVEGSILYDVRKGLRDPTGHEDNWQGLYGCY